ncbi:MAG: hypothetical protein KGH78_01045 [Candidatus Micrarchaeota archaeon]|nr:hypothetical protein [Candidatus Micrarchaeota archaeon]
MLIRIETRQLVHILSFFLIVQLGGMLLATLLFVGPQPITQTQAPAINSIEQTLSYFGAIILFAIILILIIRFYSGELLFRGLEAFAVVVPSFFFFFIIVSFLLPTAVAAAAIGLSAILAVLLYLGKIRWPVLKNTVVIVSSIGLGVVLGASFSLPQSFLLLMLVAIYDYVAVFITKHMVTFAKALSSRNLAFLVSASDVEVADKSQLGAKEFKAHMNEVKKIDNPVIKRIIKGGEVPVIAQVQLGAGDLALPLMLSISAYTLTANYFISTAIVVGGAFGLLATMIFLIRYRRPLPAIPPLFGCMCIALGLALPFTKFAGNISYSLIALGLFIIFGVMYLTLRMGEKNQQRTPKKNPR